MGQSIKIPNGIINLVDVDFNCPHCEYGYGEDFWLNRLLKSKYGLIYKSCKICKNMLGITTDIRGDVKVWLESEEEK